MAPIFAPSITYHDVPEMSLVRFRIKLRVFLPKSTTALQPLEARDNEASMLQKSASASACQQNGNPQDAAPWSRPPQGNQHEDQEFTLGPEMLEVEPIECFEDIQWQEKLISPREEAVYCTTPAHLAARNRRFAEYQTHISLIKKGYTVPFTRLARDRIYTFTERDLENGVVPHVVEGFHDLEMIPPLSHSGAGPSSMAQIVLHPGSGDMVLSPAEKYNTEIMYIMATLGRTSFIGEDVVLCHIKYNRARKTVIMTPGFSQEGKSFKATTPRGIRYEYVIEEIEEETTSQPQYEEGRALVTELPFRGPPDVLWSTWGQIEFLDRTGLLHDRAAQLDGQMALTDEFSRRYGAEGDSLAKLGGRVHQLKHFFVPILAVKLAFFQRRAHLYLYVVYQKHIIRTERMTSCTTRGTRALFRADDTNHLQMIAFVLRVLRSYAEEEGVLHLLNPLARLMEWMRPNYIVDFRLRRGWFRATSGAATGEPFEVHLAVKDTLATEKVGTLMSAPATNEFPRMYFEAISIGMLGRHCLEGYGYIDIPLEPGRHTVACQLWRPCGTWPQEVLWKFTGASPSFVSLKHVAEQPVKLSHAGSPDP